MTAGDGRIRTTHVGSLVRPDELVAYLRKIDAGAAYDEEAYEECLARSVRDVVQARSDAGIDIVSDGEFGKSAWNYYVYERLGGIELRPSAPGDANFASVNDAPTDWTRFPEFYADYFAHEQEYESPGGDWACVAPVTYTGGEVSFRFANSEWLYGSGRDPRFDRLSVGGVLLSNVIRDACDDGVEDFRSPDYADLVSLA